VLAYFLFFFSCSGAFVLLGGCRRRDRAAPDRDPRRSHRFLCQTDQLDRNAGLVGAAEITCGGPDGFFENRCAADELTPVVRRNSFVRDADATGVHPGKFGGCRAAPQVITNSRCGSFFWFSAYHMGGHRDGRGCCLTSSKTRATPTGRDGQVTEARDIHWRHPGDRGRVGVGQAVIQRSEG